MVKCAMSSLPWWKRDRTTKHPKILYGCEVKCANGQNSFLEKGTLISPIRKSFLPHGHRFTGYYDETMDMVADSPLGLVMVSLDAVEY